MNLLLLLALLTADSAPVVASSPETITLTVNDQERSALVYWPARKMEDPPAPLVLCFHGHGGTSANAARQFRMEKLWPEAVVIYPQGLRTPTVRDPRGERSGWQQRGDQYEGRDFKLVDALIAHARNEIEVDLDRIYACGHSNGGHFSYQLAAERPGLFAAIAPSAAPFVIPEKMPPIPVFHSAGLQDAIVAFNLQRRTFEAIKVLNGCEQKGKPYAAGALLFESPHKTPVVTMVHEGGHAFDSNAAPQMVRFFKENPRSLRAPSSPPKAAAPAKPESASKPAPSKEPASETPAAPPAPPVAEPVGEPVEQSR